MNKITQERLKVWALDLQKRTFSYQLQLEILDLEGKLDQGTIGLILAFDTLCRLDDALLIEEEAMTTRRFDKKLDLPITSSPSSSSSFSSTPGDKNE